MSPSSGTAHPPLAICVFLAFDPVTKTVFQELASDRYAVKVAHSEAEFRKLIEQEKQQLDCLILSNNSDLLGLANWLHGQATLLPAVLITPKLEQLHDRSVPDLNAGSARQISDFTYHTAEVRLAAEQLEQIHSAIEQAIEQFLTLSPACRLNPAAAPVDPETDLTAQNFLLLQQRRLAEKLKERLGYLGVYYKRNPQTFFRHLSPAQQQQFLDQFREDYREIVLRYFSDTDGTLNQRIDDLVNVAFFIDIPVSQIVETHMELMDEFSKQLKLEGRSEEILLDYRLTLIDTIAHLCEMYRRSIPRES